jgi:hypothetical protein
MRLVIRLISVNRLFIFFALSSSLQETPRPLALCFFLCYALITLAVIKNYYHVQVFVQEFRFGTA